MNETEYSIQEISDLSGLPRRTIHFYLQQKLLPSPEGAGLAARYGEEHLLRLRLVARLRGAGLRLDAIRSRLAGLDLAGLQALYEELLASQPPAPNPAVLPVSQTYAHYRLPAGLILAAPASLTRQERLKLDQLLQTACQLFTEAE